MLNRRFVDLAVDIEELPQQQHFHMYYHTTSATIPLKYFPKINQFAQPHYLCLYEACQSSCVSHLKSMRFVM